MEIVLKNGRFQNDRFLKGSRFVNDKPSLTIVNDDPSLTKRGGERKPT